MGIPRTYGRTFVLSIVVAAGVLAGCTPTTSTSTAFSGPGDTLAPPAVAAQFLQSACSTSDPAAVLRANGFSAPSPLGTYFHSQYNLSINPGGDRCSVVFASPESGASVSAALRSVPATVYRADPNTIYAPNTLYAAEYGG